MKKLIVTLIMATLGFGIAVVAAPVYSLKDGDHPREFIILDDEPVQYDNGYRVFTTSSKVNYNVTGSINRILEEYKDKKGEKTGLYTGIDENGTTLYDLGHVTFTTNQDVYLGVWTDIDSTPTFEPRVDMTLNVSDYGIYFIGEDGYYSTKNQGVMVEAGKEFGVYYTLAEDPDTHYTTTDNWVGSFDSGKVAHVIAGKTWFSEDDKIKTNEPFLCLFQGPYYENKPAYLEWDHFEFAFVTGEPPAGQPLPGTLATILISGICAKALSKKNKKK